MLNKNKLMLVNVANAKDAVPIVKYVKVRETIRPYNLVVAITLLGSQAGAICK